MNPMHTQIKELIHSHTGEIKDVRPITEGHGAATTFVATCDTGEFFVKATPNRPGGNLDAAVREEQINPFVLSVSPEILWTAKDPQWFVLGFEKVDGRSSDFLPGSPCLPTLIDLVNQVSAVPLPPVAQGWQETRWDRFATQQEQELLRGNALTHADIHGRNVLIGPERSWLVDWEWPTRGSEAIMPSCIAVQLVSAGHSPAEAESWVSGCDAWKRADPAAIDAFARANTRMHEWMVKVRPDEDWLKAMLTAAAAWAGHRAGTESVPQE